MRRTSSRKSLETPQEPMINITPLIDVVFVILIAFIVVAPLLELDRVALAGGGPSRSPVHFQDTSPIQIRVYKDNTLSLNDEKISLRDLPSKLLAQKRAHPKARPQLFHDKEAYFGTYQSVKNCLESVGFQEVDLVLAPL